MILGRDVCKQFSKKKINQNYTDIQNLFLF